MAARSTLWTLKSPVISLLPVLQNILFDFQHTRARALLLLHLDVIGGENPDLVVPLDLPLPPVVGCASASVDGDDITGLERQVARHCPSEVEQSLGHNTEQTQINYIDKNAWTAAA